MKLGITILATVFLSTAAAQAAPRQEFVPLAKAQGESYGGYVSIDPVATVGAIVKLPLRVARRAVAYTSSVIGGRPAGCPYQYCGCYTSLQVFGRIIPSLNLARNWYQFPRTHHAAGMAEVIGNHHVRYIEADLGGGRYRFRDGNSGRHLTRIVEGPPRGIAVNPHEGRISSAL